MNQRSLDHALRQAERALTELGARARDALDRDDRGGTNDRDGFGSNSLGSGAPMSVLHCDEHERDNCPCGNNAPVDVSSDPTGNAASGPPRIDVVHAAAGRVLSHLDEAVKHLQGAVSHVALIEHLAKSDGRSNPPTHCQACGRLVYCTSADPISSGYCAQCKRSFIDFQKRERREGREPDRARFEHERRTRLDGAA